MSERKLVVQWDDPARLRQARANMNGLGFAEKMASGELPRAPVQMLLGSRLLSVSEGEAVMDLECAEQHANPFGTVHGAVLSHLVDAAGSFAIGTRLPAAAASISFDVRTTFLRPVPVDAGVIRCTATALHVGGRIATADARVVDRHNRLCAHGIVMCLVSPV